MANNKLITMLINDVEAWNKWRESESCLWLDLCNANLSGSNLRKANLCGVNLSKACLSRADLSEANIKEV